MMPTRTATTFDSLLTYPPLGFVPAGLIAVALRVCLMAGVLILASTVATAAPGYGEWKAMLSGTNGWHTCKTTTFPDKGWVFRSYGSLHHLPKGGGGDLLSDLITSNDFEFRWDWKIAPGGNSGVKYFISEDRPEVVGHEYQII